ncbi:MAG: DEAD/DEAH box helicase [Phycisphaerales bacterium]
MKFDDLTLAPSLLKALHEEGYATPTPIQAKAIPPALEGKDVLGIAQTGTGKTAAFSLPTLHRLCSQPATPGIKGPRALVLAPTRELAAQIGESFNNYGRHTGLRTAVIFGGVGQGPQVQAIRSGAAILVATPGRLIDLMDQKLVDLRGIQFFTLDEADRMLDMGFIEPIRRIAKAVPQKRQTMLFSATMPTEIRGLANSLLHQAVEVSVTPAATTVERIAQCVYSIERGRKVDLLAHLLRDPAAKRSVVFTKTKHGADKVVRRLRAAGIASDAIHGNKAQNQRTRTLDGFRSGRTPVLVATDIAARGLDVDGITHVFNFDLPMEPEAYVHRIGRTARAGASGVAITFCDDEERGLLKQVEKLTKANIERKQVPADLVALPKPAAGKGGPTHQPHGGGRGSQPSGGHGGGHGGGGRGGKKRGGRGGKPSGKHGGHHGGSHGGGNTSAQPAHAGGGDASPVSSADKPAPARHNWPGYRGPSRRGR